LRPLLDLHHIKLPFELREQIYRLLFDEGTPRTVPRSESTANASKARGCMDASEIFQGEYIFDDDIMGVATSQEIQEVFLRRSPIYFRGCTEYPNVQQLLDVELSSGKRVRDLVRQLRVHLRLERFEHERHVTNFGIISTHSIIRAMNVETAFYDTCSARLNALDQLPFGDYKIKIEICVFHREYKQDPFSGDDTEVVRVRCEFFETVKPAYHQARNAGAEVSVHWEDLAIYEDHGNYLDATELYAQDAEAWAKVRPITR